jgi:hypothetical protein
MLSGQHVECREGASESVVVYLEYQVREWSCVGRVGQVVKRRTRRRRVPATTALLCTTSRHGALSRQLGRPTNHFGAVVLVVALHLDCAARERARERVLWCVLAASGSPSTVGSVRVRRARALPARLAGLATQWQRWEWRPACFVPGDTGCLGQGLGALGSGTWGTWSGTRGTWPGPRGHSARDSRQMASAHVHVTMACLARRRQREQNATPRHATQRKRRPTPSNTQTTPSTRTPPTTRRRHRRPIDVQSAETHAGGSPVGGACAGTPITRGSGLTPRRYSRGLRLPAAGR